MIKLTRQEHIQRQKDLGCYSPVFHPSVESPSPSATPFCLVQAYWLHHLQEEIVEAYFADSLKKLFSEVADIIIFAEAFHFTLTDNPFVFSVEDLAKDFAYDNLEECLQAANTLAINRKSWKSYQSGPVTLNSWLAGTVLMFLSTEQFEELQSYYEAKVNYNYARKDWDNR